MQFTCRLGTPDGKVVEELREARDEVTLRSDLERRGYHIFDLRRRGLLSLLRLPSLVRRDRRIPQRTLLIFNQEMAALLRSGLPLLQTLSMLRDRQRDPFFQGVLAQVYERVKGGEELSAAFGSFGNMFPPLFAPTIKAGERSGDLEEVLRRFIRYQNLLMEARKRVISALVYPTVLICLSLVLIGVMTVYVVPKFTDFFTDLEADLPLVTRLTMGISIFVQHNFPVIFVVATVVALAVLQWSRSQAGEVTVARWQLRLPLLGTIFHRLALSEFCRSLSTLLAGGLPVVSAIDVSVGAVGNAWVRRQLAPMTQRVREGKSLNAALEESGVAPDIAIDMIRVGEATGALSDMLNDVSSFFDEEVETRMQRVLSLIEPVMLVLMGTIVATLLVSIYLPLFGLMGSAGF